MVIVFRQFWELQVNHFAVNAFHFSLDPALNLLSFLVAVDPHIDTVAGLELLSPGLASCGHFLQFFVGHLKVFPVKDVIGLEAPRECTGEVLMVSLLLHLVTEEVHEGAHRIRRCFDILRQGMMSMVKSVEKKLEVLLTAISKVDVLESFCMSPIATSSLIHLANSGSLAMRSVATASLTASQIILSSSKGVPRRLSAILPASNASLSYYRLLYCSVICLINIFYSKLG